MIDLVIYTYVLVAVAMIIAGLIGFVLILDRDAKPCEERNARRTNRCAKCGEREKESSIAATARVKDSTRRARQRKAKRRMK